MTKLFIMAAALLLLAGCSSNQQDMGGSGIYLPGASGGATGTPSGTSEDPAGSGGGGLQNPPSATK